MSTTELVRENLASPMVLAFVLGLLAALLRSDLRLPKDIVKALSMYLLLAIGLKGGVALGESGLSVVLVPALGTLALGLVTPLFAYLAARRVGRLDVTNAAALAAHYGSVSVVTFVAAGLFVSSIGISSEPYMAALVALLEVPAIIVALTLALRSNSGNVKSALREVVFGTSIVLLLGGVAIGFASGKTGFAQVEGFFVTPFKGALTLFLLELGIVAGGHIRSVGRHGFFLTGFAIVVPVVQGALGVFVGKLCGLSAGGAMILGTMAASASYIAAPAAVRVALPKADPALYLTSALGITFPFNLAIGIPLYTAMAKGEMPSAVMTLIASLP